MLLGMATSLTDNSLPQHVRVHVQSSPVRIEAWQHVLFPASLSHLNMACSGSKKTKQYTRSKAK